MIEAAPVKLTMLRKAIRNNHVSFPSQIPLFVRKAPGNLQRYSVQLYFLSGWNCGKIARRYGYSRLYIWQIVNDWKRHAISLGYLQAIPPAGVLLDLKNALQLTLDRAARLGQGNFKTRTEISGNVADRELAQPLEAWFRKAAVPRQHSVPSAQARGPEKEGCEPVIKISKAVQDLRHFRGGG